MRLALARALFVKVQDYIIQRFFADDVHLAASSFA